ncbi:Vacuolar protein sorting protein 26 related like protein [Aduncisulcus paluster]|uniref:Vacuolar protein sorting protein 26 related like protein n=1 Tax=Aduncisulcus paluster TaxID=2918883 RepID=A0ABQ5JZS7_9EUKA|nr:Vacuolar protein sorting protein 26 related like protein [Aduncisulcus paluster]
MFSKLFGAPGTIQIEFAMADKRKKMNDLVCFSAHEDVVGHAILLPNNGKQFDHNGVKVELCGVIESLVDSKLNTRFCHAEEKLRGPSVLTSRGDKVEFRFRGVPREYDSYHGKNVVCKYFIRVTVQRGRSHFSEERQFFSMQNRAQSPPVGRPVKMEVGVEQVLNIEFEFNKNIYGMSDVILAKVYFMAIYQKLSRMEVEIVRNEVCGEGVMTHTHDDVLASFEVMDGEPVRGETIPVRVYLKGIPLTPTYTRIAGIFSVGYRLNLTIYDTDGNKFFKAHPIRVYRDEHSLIKEVAVPEFTDEHPGYGPASSYRQAQAVLPPQHGYRYTGNPHEQQRPAPQPQYQPQPQAPSREPQGYGQPPAPSREPQGYGQPPAPSHQAPVERGGYGDGYDDGYGQAPAKASQGYGPDGYGAPSGTPSQPQGYGESSPQGYGKASPQGYGEQAPSFAADQSYGAEGGYDDYY